MTGADIVCFAKDWDDDPTSNTHVMRRLAAMGNRVLWLNSIGIRAPTIGSGRDLRRIVRKLEDFARGTRQVAPNLWVFTPLVIPLPYHPVATWINRLLLRVTVRRLRRRLGMGAFQLWTFLPSAGAYAGSLGESLLVYYCTDNWRHAYTVDGVRLDDLERRLCARADIVFATSRSLLEAKRPLNPETHLASHGVDHTHFARALAMDTQVAPEIAALPTPVLGVIGLIDHRIDIGLLCLLAARHPEWTIAVIGPAIVDTAPLAAHPNIRLLGRRPYARLPELCKGLAAGLVPFVLDEHTRDINPIKLREYLSAGLPVIATALPEVAAYRPLCAVAESHDEFERLVAAALHDDSPARRAERSAMMRGEGWDAKVAALSREVERVWRERHPA